MAMNHYKDRVKISSQLGEKEEWLNSQEDFIYFTSHSQSSKVLGDYEHPYFLGDRKYGAQ